MIKLDDFDDGNTLPSLSPFSPWECYRFEAIQEPPRCSIGNGADDTLGLSIEFAFRIPANSRPLTGAGYGTIVNPSPEPSGSRQVLNAKTITSIEFDAKWETSSSELNETRTLKVRLPCSSLEGAKLGQVDDYAVEDDVALSRNWVHYSVALEGFHQPNSTSQRIDEQGCIGAADGLFFNVEGPGSPDMEYSEAGSIAIDNVYFELPASASNVSITSLP